MLLLVHSCFSIISIFFSIVKRDKISFTFSIVFILIYLIFYGSSRSTFGNDIYGYSQFFYEVASLPKIEFLQVQFMTAAIYLDWFSFYFILHGCIIYVGLVLFARSLKVNEFLVLCVWLCAFSLVRDFASTRLAACQISLLLYLTIAWRHQYTTAKHILMLTLFTLISGGLHFFGYIATPIIALCTLFGKKLKASNIVMFTSLILIIFLIVATLIDKLAIAYLPHFLLGKVQSYTSQVNVNFTFVALVILLKKITLLLAVSLLLKPIHFTPNAGPIYTLVLIEIILYISALSTGFDLFSRASSAFTIFTLPAYVLLFRVGSKFVKLLGLLPFIFDVFGNVLLVMQYHDAYL